MCAECEGMVKKVHYGGGISTNYYSFNIPLAIASHSMPKIVS